MSEEELWAKIRHLEGQMNDIRRATLRAKENPDRTVYAFYQSNAENAVAHATLTIFNFEDKVIDTHNCVTVGAAWKFTAPMTANYIAATGILWAANAEWAAGEALSLQLYKNGVFYCSVNQMNNQVANSQCFIGGSIPIYLKTGDYISFKIYHNMGVGTTLTAYSGAEYVWCAICQARFI